MVEPGTSTVRSDCAIGPNPFKKSAPGSSNHFLFVYQDKEQALEAFASFLGEAADRGEKCLFLSEDTTSTRDRLAAAGLSGERFELLSLADWYLGNGALDPDGSCERWRAHAENARAEGYNGLAAIVDLGSFFAVRDQLEASSKYERCLHALSLDIPVNIVCAYRRASLWEPYFSGIALSHHAVACAVTGDELNSLSKEHPDLAPDRVEDATPMSETGLCYVPSKNGGTYVVASGEGHGTPLSEITRVHQHLFDTDTAEAARILRQAQGLSAYLKAMESVLAASVTGTDILLIMHDVASKVVRALEADGGWISLLDQGSLEPETIAEEALKDEHGLLTSLARRAAEADRPIIESDKEVILHDGLSHVTLVAFPLRIHEGTGARPAGAMVLASRSGSRAEAWEDQVLLRLGEEVGLVLQRARLRHKGDTDSIKAAMVIQAAADGIMVIDEEQRIENVNPALEALTGFSRDELLGKSCRYVLQSRLASGEYLCDVICPISSPTRRGSNTVETTIQKKSGDTCWIEATSIPMYDSSDRMIGAVYTLRDITERKETDRLKDDFISLVSHEFRSPVTVIMGMASTLLRKEMPLLATARSGLKDILAQAKRLNRLVDNLLIITRSRAGSLEITPEHVRVDKIGGKLIKELQAQAQGRGRSFTMDFPREFPPAFADPVRLELVLRNLLENAIKFSPDGGPIRLWGRQEDSLIVIGVEDHGMGIPAKYLESIFQAFYRLDDPHVQAKPGIGLGLAACRHVVEAHGGRLWAESEPGRGSVFAFTLPAQRKSNQA